MLLLPGVHVSRRRCGSSAAATPPPRVAAGVIATLALMSTSRSRQPRAAARPARKRQERQQDARLAATQIVADGPGVRKGDLVVSVSPVNLPDGRRLMWHPPQPVAFNLLEAKRRRDRGVSQRRNIMGNLVKRPDGGYGPANSHATLDCLSELAAAVLFAFTAIESLANHAIDLLPDETVVRVRKGRAIPKPDLVQLLGIDDKLKRVVPLLDQGASVAGTAAWERYLALKNLRGELVHVKRRGYDPDPDVLTAYDRLIMGEGDSCVEDARAVVDRAFPGFLPDNVLRDLA